MKKANVNVNTLEVNKKNILKLKFNKMLQNLNALLLSQYLIKTGLNITKGDLKEIQQTDHNLSLKIAELNKQHISEIKDFQLHEGILYKVSIVYGQQLFRLALPKFLGQDILRSLHHKSEAHLTLNNLLAVFNQNFYTPGIN